MQEASGTDSGNEVDSSGRDAESGAGRARLGFHASKFQFSKKDPVMKSSNVLICGLSACLLALGLATLLSPVNARENKESEQRYSIIQRTTADTASLAIMDRKTHEQVSIYNGAKDGGACVAFWASGPINGTMNTLPRLVIHSRGIQIVDKSGNMRHIDIEELASLDRPKPPTRDELDDSDEDDTGVPIIRNAMPEDFQPGGQYYKSTSTDNRGGNFKSYPVQCDVDG